MANTYSKHFQSAERARDYADGEYRTGSYAAHIHDLETAMLDDRLRRYVAKNGPVIDFACGTGRFLATSASAHPVLGVDISNEMLEIAQEVVSEESLGNVTLKRVDISDSDALESVGAGSFAGAVMMRFVLNARHELSVDAFRFIHSTLEESGILIVNNHSRVASVRVLSVLTKVLNRVRRRTSDVGNTLSDRAFLKLCDETGFEIIESTGYGLLGARLAALSGESLSRSVEQRSPRWLLRSIGTHRMYTLRKSA